MRHAASSHVERRWIDARGFVDWRSAYEAAGIAASEKPPETLRALADLGAVVVSSDAPRAVATARLLSRGREIVASSLLRELDLDTFPVPGIRLPLRGWAVLVGLKTLSLTVRGRYPSAAEAQRIADAASWLDSIASESLVIAVTHASFRKQLFQTFTRRGFKPDGEARSWAHWSAWFLDSNVP